MSTVGRKVTRGMSALILAYCGSYLVLTLLGRYEPAVWGLRGPKWYQWAPWGFVHEMRWRAGPALLFLPLWELDRFFWHTSDLAFSGRYPANLIVDAETPEPDGPANGSQPVHSETNQASEAARSRH